MTLRSVYRVIAIAVGSAALAAGLLGPLDTASAQSGTVSCATGGAVVDADSNPGLVSDCEALLNGRDALAGRATLNWSDSTPISQWEGVILTGSPLRVTALELASKGLSGELPGELGGLDQLGRLELQNNELTGQIPPELANLSKLFRLFLSNNKLAGEMPSELSNLKILRYFTVYDNEMTGELPQSYIALQPRSFYFQFNLGLCAPINDAFQLWMQSIDNVRGSSCAREDSKRDRTVLIDLYNSLDGKNWLRNDNWESDRPIRTWYGITNDVNGRVTELRLRYNQMSGELPEEIGNLENLELLNLRYNKLSGEVPEELGNLASLKQLLIDNNNLTGEIPSTLGNLTNLKWLYLQRNQLRGKIPSDLGNLMNLGTLRLDSNELTGEIPIELGNLEILTWLNLSKNRLTGEIPPELGDLANLDWLYLSFNQLTGEIPPELGGLASLYELGLHYNQFTGEIPPELGGLANLEGLDLHSNQLTGEIPEELGNLENLTWLMLADNQLTGEIPMELARLTNLERLSLSRNQLVGCIPGTLRQAAYNDLVNIGLPFCDTLLSSLTINPGSLFPLFDPNQTEYTIAVGRSRITVVPANDHDATILFLDESGDAIADADDTQPGYQVDFSTELPNIRIRVVSEDGLAFKTYMIADLGIRYDANESGVIDRDEVITAIKDYFDYSITRDETIAIIKLYFSS